MQIKDAAHSLFSSEKLFKPYIASKIISEAGVPLQRELMDRHRLSILKEED
ncbi:MAG: hypothetical protein HZA08_07860 [Nitrospirae bacterium]|nr:hypothetical protein [Nitrospirota bacterium]